MVDQKVDQEIVDSTSAIETALSALWEKAREASLLISTLRDEKKSLLQRVDELEEEIKNLQDDATVKQTTIEQMKQDVSENSREANKHDGIGLSAEDKKEFESKIKTVISKLDQYLSP